MAIIAPQTAPNWATGDYHRILKAEVVCSPLEPVPRWRIMVGFYVSAEARAACVDPVYVRSVDLPFSDTIPDPRGDLYELLMQTPLFVNTNAAPDESVA